MVGAVGTCGVGMNLQWPLVGPGVHMGLELRDAEWGRGCPGAWVTGRRDR